jgi:hypothetical protein
VSIGEVLHQRRLAYPRLAADQHHASLARARCGERNIELVQRGLALEQVHRHYQRRAYRAVPWSLAAVIPWRRPQLRFDLAEPSRNASGADDKLCPARPRVQGRFTWDSRPSVIGRAASPRLLIVHRRGRI